MTPLDLARPADAVRLDGKVALVTGAGGGIGAAIAVAFGALGAETIVHYHRNGEGAQRTVGAIEEAGGRAVAVGADLSSRDGVESLLAAASGDRVDVVVNNAGDLIRRSPLHEASDELYDEVLDTNLRSTFMICRAVLPGMRARQSGSIINVSSVAARNGGGAGSVLYAAAKAAVSTLTRGLAKEVAAEGIRVNAIAPGVIRTAFHERNSDEQTLRAMTSTIPLGRVGTAEECAGAAVYLASEGLSGYVTGQVIEVNGGQFMP